MQWSVLIYSIIIFAGIRWPGIWLSGFFLSYQASIISGNSFLGEAYTAIIIFLILLLLRGKRIRHLNSADTLFVTYLAYAAISAFLGPASGKEIFLRLLAAGGATYFIGRFISTFPLPALVRQMLAGLAMFGALFGLLMMAHRDIAVAGRLVVGSGSAVGLASPLAFVIAATMFLMIYAMEKRRMWQVAVFGSALLFDIYVAVISGTRGVFVSALVGIATFVLLATANIRPATILGGILATSGALWYLVPKLLSDSTFATGLLRLLTNIGQGGVMLDPSALERLERFRAAWAMFRESPFIGFGMGAFDARTGLGYPHNIVLELLSEQGLIGLAFFLAFIAAVLWPSRQILKHPGFRIEAAVLIALFVAELAYLNLSMTLWMAKPLFLLGGLVSSARLSSSKKMVNEKQSQCTMPRSRCAVNVLVNKESLDKPTDER